MAVGGHSGSLDTSPDSVCFSPKLPHALRAVQRNNALHLQIAPVIILAFARMPPYAAFKLA